MYICAGCALWAARRASGLNITVPLRVWLERLRAQGRGSDARSAIPILPSADLAATEAHYSKLGFDVAGRYDGYLVMHDGPVELHFSQTPPGEQSVSLTPGTCFVHVRDAVAYWKKLREADVLGVSAPEEQAYGLVEFVVTDPLGNRVRFGSPAH
ncbi:VOC family protein [Nocardioides pocheonensis]|uniref:Glyoxalase/fosfomycin resistance/dioxygenase domain-containing protein n=1 Tax=Nocardioides pocheonensis TaxID=661485 RepID=A0A3N0GHZ7_9ACTN|nr:VOC family protein [Nocardioides pocheonensis]RNM12069.1 hypothetical protein EFL26_19825 [Nocardioides pocheonensis]